VAGDTPQDNFLIVDEWKKAPKMRHEFPIVKPLLRIEVLAKQTWVSTYSTMTNDVILEVRSAIGNIDL
jgi:hypothetical protein